MTISYVNRGTQKNYSGSAIGSQTFTFATPTDFPGGNQENDFMLLIVRQLETYVTASGPTTPDTPTGWTYEETQARTINLGGGNSQTLALFVYSRTASSNADVEFDLTWSGTNPGSGGTYVAAIHSFRGSHIEIASGGSAPVGVSSTGTSPTGQPSIPAVQPAYALSIAAVNSTSAPSKAPGLGELFGVAPGVIIASGVHSRMVIDTKRVEASTVLFPAYNMPNANTWVTLSLLLIEPPWLEATPSTLDIGDAVVGDTLSDSMFVTNVGAADVVFQAPYADIDEPDWDHQPDLDNNFASSTGRVGPGQTVEVTIWINPIAAGEQTATYSVPYTERTLSVPLVARGVAPVEQSTCQVAFATVGEITQNVWSCTIVPPVAPREGEAWEIVYIVTTSEPSDSVNLRYIAEWPEAYGDAQLSYRSIDYGSVSSAWSTPISVPKVNDPLAANGRYITQGFFPSWTGVEMYEVRLTGIAVSAGSGQILMSTENLEA